MNLTFEEIKERLTKLDEVTLLEVLEISSEDIVERFMDLIELKIDDLEEELSDEEDYE
jgi:hypothetical protein